MKLSKDYKDTAVLTIVGGIGKVFSVLFKIILIYIIGIVGIGIYQQTFPIFVFLYSICSVGPATIITMEIAGDKDGNSSKKVAYVFKFSSVMIGIASVVVLALSKKLAVLQGNVGATYGYMGVAITLIFVGVLTNLRGVLRGRQKIVQYAISDLIEQVFKIVFSILFAWLFIKHSLQFSIFGVYIGISISALISLLYCIKSIESPSGVAEQLPNNWKKSTRSLIFQASITAIIIPIMQFAESIIVLRLLQKMFELSSSGAVALFGLSRGTVSALINLPNTLFSAIEFIVLPRLLNCTSKWVMQKKLQSYLSFVLFSSIVISGLFFIFSENILTILYHNQLSSQNLHTAVVLLKFGSLSIIFSAIAQIFSVALQGIKKLNCSIYALIVASIVKLGIEVLLIKHYGIYAIEISNILFYIMLAMVTGLLLWFNGIRFGSLSNIVFILASGLIVVLVQLAYRLLLIIMNKYIAMIMSAVLILLVCSCVFLIYVRKQNRLKLNEVLNKS